MTPLVLLLIGLGLIIFVGVPILLLLNRKTFKNKVWIARQTGKSYSEVVWIEDFCRVVNKDGAWTIEFKKLKEKTRSVDGSLWSKLLNKKFQAKALKFDKTDWDSLDIRSNLMRGLFLYETTEGEFYPMQIDRKDDKNFTFRILSQDNRQFIITEIQGINDLTRNHKKELTLLWGIVIGIFVMAVVFFAALWWMGRMHDQNIITTMQACSGFLQSASSGNTSTYLNQFTSTLGG
jgi:hypothetical protein